MRRAALRDYLSQIEGLLDENRLPEAAAHCHFILKQYPRHVDTYRLYGRTLLEQQLFDEAKDVFTRLLSADPDDLVSHAGLALAHSNGRDFDSAIWHMERAFDIDPYNRAVQDELRKLYISRNGDAPPRLALTRPALARLYLKGAMYRQAANELTSLLAQNPGRLDLQLALADALYWDSKQVEAAGVCEKIIAHLPFCIKANAILGDAWLRADRVAEAHEHLRRVQELTLLDRAQMRPDSTLGRAISNPRIEIPESVQVEILDDSLAIAGDLAQADAWPEQPIASKVEGDRAPDWLLEIGDYDTELQLEAGPVSESEEIRNWREEAAVASSELPVELDEETGLDDELLLLEPDEQMDLLQESQTIESASQDEYGSFDAVPDDSPRPAQVDTELVQNEPLERSAARGDEAEEALDDLLSYIDDGDDDATNAESGPEWLGELANNTDLADELPDWLYEAVGLGAPEEGTDNNEEPEPIDQVLTADVEGDDEQVGRLDPGVEPAGRTEGEPVSFGGEHDQATVDPEPGTAESSRHDEVPDWLLEIGEAMKESPDEPFAETVAGQGATQDTEGEMAIWLEELSDQLEENDGEPGTPGAPHEEQS